MGGAAGLAHAIRDAGWSLEANIPLPSTALFVAAGIALRVSPLEALRIE